MLIQPALELTKKSDKVQPPRRIAILGSTGSIGQSTLEVVRQNPGFFEVHTLVAGSNAKLLSQQIAEFKPRYAALNITCADLDLSSTSNCEVVYGTQAICELVANPELDLVVAAISGNFGVASTIAALQAGQVVALANKESLVCAGSYLGSLIKESGAVILPVDSEHSALFQALQGERYGDIEKLVITASGGPFLKLATQDFDKITPEQALKHPRWEMGSKITIDSSTLMNKALEVIEAYWLFGLEPNKIEVLVHPQSIVHSLVSFCDGTQIAQLSETSMLGPIAYSLSYPYGRLRTVMPQLNLAEQACLDFMELDNKRFPAVNTAKQCLQSGQMAQIVFSVANEVAVRKFLTREIGFLGISSLVETSLGRYSDRELPNLSDLGNYIAELDQEISSH